MLKAQNEELKQSFEDLKVTVKAIAKAVVKQEDDIVLVADPKRDKAVAHFKDNHTVSDYFITKTGQLSCNYNIRSISYSAIDNTILTGYFSKGGWIYSAKYRTSVIDADSFSFTKKQYNHDPTKEIRYLSQT